ncbi:MAG: PAS domain S-box protein [Cyanobacteriota bacterium]
MASPPLRSPLATTLLLILGSILIITSVTLLWGNHQLWRLEEKKIIDERAETIARGIEYATEDLIESQSLYSITKRIVQNFATFADVARIEIINPDGSLLIGAPDDSRSQETWQVVRPEYQASLTKVAESGTALFRTIRKDRISLALKVIPFNSNLFIKQKNFGLIVVVLDLTSLENRGERFLFLSGLLILTGLSLALVGAYFAFYKRVVSPLHKLQIFLTQVEYGQHQILPSLHQDEIGFLGLVLQEKIQELDHLNQQLDQRVNATTEVLAQTETFLQSILDYLPVALFVKDASPENFGKIILWNPACESLFGLSAQEVWGKTVFDLYALENAQAYDQEDRQVVLKREWINAPKERFEKFENGETVTYYLHIRKIPLLNAQGEAQFLLCMAEDITERQLAQDNLERLNQDLEKTVLERTQSLQESELRYRSLLEGASDALLICDLEGKIVEVNQKALVLFQTMRQHLLGRHMQSLHPPEAVAENLATFGAIMSQGRAECLDTQIVTQTGKILPVDITASLIQFQGQSLVMGIFRDVTERKRAEQETARALETERELTQLKSQFIDVASHEFRTPLTVILSGAEFLERYYAKLSDEKKRHYLHRIIESAQRMREMIEDVLILSRLDAGKIALHLAPIELTPFCRRLIEEVEEETRYSHNIRWRLDYAPLDNDGMTGDIRILYPIFVNLLSNAIKYSPQAQSVDFQARLESEKVIFTIDDQGIGIPPQDLPYIFESFHRGANVEDISGTGLGLNIVKRYAELHGGQITVHSQVGAGSRFIVTLPRYFGSDSGGEDAG